MARFSLSFFLISLTALAALHGTHAVNYIVKNPAVNTPGGTRFKNELGGIIPVDRMSTATNFIWNLFKQTLSPSERKNVQLVTLIVENIGGVAYTSNNEIHFSAQYIQSIQPGMGNLVYEFNGVIFHEMTHVWQWNGNGGAPSGLIEGIADFVRLKAGYAPGHWVKNGEGNRWDQGYDVTARFLDYCESVKTGFVADLNRKMRFGYSVNFFKDITGRTVDQLWRDYKAKFGK
ncbi:hypothetical protein ACE6H2_019752 [Prunus campanulata]